VFGDFIMFLLLSVVFWLLCLFRFCGFLAASGNQFRTVSVNISHQMVQLPCKTEGVDLF